MNLKSAKRYFLLAAALSALVFVWELVEVLNRRAGAAEVVLTGVLTFVFGVLAIFAALMSRWQHAPAPVLSTAQIAAAQLRIRQYVRWAAVIATFVTMGTMTIWGLSSGRRTPIFGGIIAVATLWIVTWRYLRPKQG